MRPTIDSDDDPTPKSSMAMASPRSASSRSASIPCDVWLATADSVTSTTTLPGGTSWRSRAETISGTSRPEVLRVRPLMLTPTAMPPRSSTSAHCAIARSTTHSSRIGTMPSISAAGTKLPAAMVPPPGRSQRTSASWPTTVRSESCTTGW